MSPGGGRRRRLAGTLLAVYWPAGLAAALALARLHKFRVGPVQAAGFLLQDLAMAAALGLLLHVILTRRSGRARRPLHPLKRTLLALAVFTPPFWLALVGLMVTGLLQVPVSANLLLQAPSLIFMRTALNTDSVAHSLSKLAVAAVGVPAVLAAGGWLLERGSVGVRRPRLRWPAMAAVLALAAASPWLCRDEQYRDTNAAVTLASSALGMAVSAGPPAPAIRPEEFQARLADVRREPLRAVPPALERLRFDGVRYDVLLIVLETGVPAVLDLERADPRWLPNLRRLAARSLRCRRHLAPFPASTKAIFGLVASRYPFPNYRSLTRMRPEAGFETFASILAREGYRTGCYASIDGDFDRMDAFLAAHGFAELGDRRSLGLTPFGDPTFGSDAEMAGRCLEWLAREPGKPALFMLLPSNSHWPFFFPEEDRVFAGDAPLARYRNALQHQDRILGGLLAGLSAAGRLERTIVVCVADHGAFFNLTAGVTADAAGLSSCHVPLLIDHPRLRNEPSPPAIDEATSHVDLGPTLLDMCSRTTLPPDVQGISLLRPRPAQRLVFFCRDYARGTVAATDGRLVAVGDQQGGALSFHLWTLSSSLQPAGAEEAPPWLREDCARRLREFFGYQVHYLWGLGRVAGRR